MMKGARSSAEKEGRQWNSIIPAQMIEYADTVTTVSISCGASTHLGGAGWDAFAVVSMPGIFNATLAIRAAKIIK